MPRVRKPAYDIKRQNVGPRAASYVLIVAYPKPVSELKRFTQKESRSRSRRRISLRFQFLKNRQLSINIIGSNIGISSIFSFYLFLSGI